MKDNRIKIYDGKTPSDFQRIDEISSDKRNYYKGFDGDLLYAETNEYGDTDWFLVIDENIWVKKNIGYSHSSDGNKIRINWFL